MSLERWIRLIAGTFIIVSVALSYFHSHLWLWFTLFVGINLFQSALTRWCLMEDILRKFGVGAARTRLRRHPTPTGPRRVFVRRVAMLRSAIALSALVIVVRRRGSGPGIRGARRGFRWAKRSRWPCAITVR